MLMTTLRRDARPSGADAAPLPPDGQARGHGRQRRRRPVGVHRCRGGVPSRLASTRSLCRAVGDLAALHAAWALEIVLNLRYRFRAAILPLLQDAAGMHRGPRGRRGHRRGVRLGTGLAAWAWRRHRGDRAALGAIAGSAPAFLLLAVETISLHRVDAVMYAEAGPLVLLAWAWIGAAAIVIASALAASPERSRFPAGTRARAAGGDG